MNLADDDVIKYHLMPSLQHASMINIIISLWDQADIKHQIANEIKYCRSFSMKLFQKIEDKVLDKLSQLPVPCRVRKILSNKIHPIGNEILEWINYQDKYIFNTFYDSFRRVRSIAINYINYLVWTARGVIDYKETAKSLLAKGESLSDCHKYNIACAYCFETDIAIIAPKVINTTLTLECIERQAMVYFWTARITRDSSELVEAVNFYNRKYRTNYSENEWLFKVLIDNHKNKVAIKYIWDQLSNEEKSRQIVPAIKKTLDTDIRCFLLSQITKEQEKEVFKPKDATRILLGFLDDWLWEPCFLPTIRHIWHVMSGYDYLDVLQGIVNKMEKNHEDIEKYNQYKSIFKELWQCSPIHLKEYVLTEGKDYKVEFIFLTLFYEKNLDIVQLILADINDVQKKEIIFSLSGLDKCQIFVKSNQWHLLEMLMGYTLSSRKDVDSFKEKFINIKGKDTAVHFIQKKEWNKVEQFLQWAFKSDNAIRTFKSILAHSKICKDILKSIVANKKADFMELEYFFEWCASGNAKEVVNFKEIIPELYFDEVIIELIRENNYELLEQILNWCLIDHPKQVALFKRYFYDVEIINEVVDLIFYLIVRGELEAFEKFLHWCFINEEEINKFKTYILYPTEDTIGVCMKLILSRELILADEFVSCCFNSSQIQIDNFKNELMIHDSINYISVEDKRLYYETEIIRWFNPSKETVIKFKEKFLGCWWFDIALNELDIYLKEQEHTRDKAINTDVYNILQDLIFAVSNQDHDIIHCKYDVTVGPTGVITEDTSIIL